MLNISMAVKQEATFASPPTWAEVLLNDMKHILVHWFTAVSHLTVLDLL